MAIRCRKCGAQIAYVTMAATGRRMPVDVPASKIGTIAAKRLGATLQHGYMITALAPLQEGYLPFVTHFAACDPEHKAVPRPEPTATLFD